LSARLNAGVAAEFARTLQACGLGYIRHMGNQGQIRRLAGILQ